MNSYYKQMGTTDKIVAQAMHLKMAKEHPRGLVEKLATTAISRFVYNTQLESPSPNGLHI
jgi:hypothetical protein